MTQAVLLNNVDHVDLRIETARGARYGDDLMLAPTFPGEFRDVQAHYPIVFAPTPDGTFQPVALFGFREGENLFLEGDRWDATYLPLAVHRQPFLIGRQGDELVVHVDLAHPRAGRSGERLFLEHGGSTDYLERATSVLLALHEGLSATPAFVAALAELQLIEPFMLDVELDDGTQNRLAGFSTIHEERLRALDATALEHLHRAGHLEAAYMVLASLANFRALIERMNRRHARRA
ncbi:SapC family protein [Lysobacter humi (ex Lee et al. 2017)]